MASTVDREALVCEHIEFATGVARAFCKKRRQFGFELEEMEGAALLGLVDAAQRYEPSHGVRFNAFSAVRIRGAMADQMRRGGAKSMSWIRNRVDRGICQNLPNELLSLVHARTNREFATALNAIDEVPFQLRIRIIDEDAEDIQLSYSRAMGPDQYVEQNNMQQYLLFCIEQLPPEEGRILRLHYFDGLSYSQMRSLFRGMSKAGLSRLHNRAIGSLRLVLQADQTRCNQLLERRAQRSERRRSA